MAQFEILGATQMNILITLSDIIEFIVFLIIVAWAIGMFIAHKLDERYKQKVKDNESTD